VVGNLISEKIGLTAVVLKFLFGKYIIGQYINYLNLSVFNYLKFTRFLLVIYLVPRDWGFLCRFSLFVWIS